MLNLRISALPAELVAAYTLPSASSAIAPLEPAARGKVFDLAGDDVLTMREMVETVLRVTRRRRLLLPLPFAIARTQAALAEFCFAKLLRRPPPLNRDQVTMLREDNVSDTHQADELFGLRHEPFAEAIARYLQQSR